MATSVVYIEKWNFNFEIFHKCLEYINFQFVQIASEDQSWFMKSQIPHGLSEKQ